MRVFSVSSYLYVLIVACEAAFWVVVLLALAARYFLKRERLSRTLLFSLPAIDLLLLVLTALDLRSGTPPAFAHGLATAYVGFTIAFGSIAIGWADAHFAHRFIGGPKPVGAPTRGWPIVRYDLDLWVRSLVAWAIALALVTALIAWLDDRARTEPLEQWYRVAFGSAVLWFVFGPLWSLLFHSWRRSD